MTRSLVTGGAGFIGSHLVDQLVARGDEVVVIDDLSTGRAANLESALGGGATLVEGSVIDVGLVESQFASFEPDRVFHLAAQVSVRRAVTDPSNDATINLLGTINLLEAAREHEVDSFLLASTGGAIYGEGKDRQLPLAEDAATEPETGYGASKLAAETYVSLYRRLHGLPGASLRFANVYGPRQDPNGEAGVVAIFSGLLERGEPLGVVGDGLQTRDYVYVDDVVAAVLAAERALAGATEEGMESPVNIGTGVEATVLDLVEGLSAAAGVEPNFEHIPQRPGEIRRISIDPATAERVLGWRPSTELREGLRLTYEGLAAAS